MDKTRLGIVTFAAAFALSAFGVPALAQDTPGSASDYKLPPASPRANPGVEGPVDADVPTVAAPERSRPTPTAAPEPEAAPVPAPQASPQAEPTPAPVRAQLAPTRPAPALPRVATTPAAEPPPLPVAPTPQAEFLPPSASGIPSASPGFVSLDPEAARPEENRQGWLIPAAIAILALLGGGVFFARKRRQPEDTAPEWQEAPTPSPPARPLTARPLTARPAAARPVNAPKPAPTPIPTPGFGRAFGAGSIAMTLEPVRLSTTLFYAVLQYRLKLTNAGKEALGPLTVAGDMISAHASRGAEAQLHADEQKLAPRHSVPALSPGEAVELKGEIRLPISEITPIPQGRSALFVPLVHLLTKGERSDGGEARASATFVVGEPPQGPGGRIRPFRLDAGPRIYNDIEQRELTHAG